MNWENVRRKVAAFYIRGDELSQSYFHRWVRIIETLSAWGVDPRDLNGACLTNLKLITKHVEAAIDRGDRDEVVRLCHKAGWSGNVNLRLDLNGPPSNPRNKVLVTRLQGEYAPLYRMEVTEWQMERIRFLSRSQMAFETGE